MSSDLAPWTDTPSLQIQLLDNSTALDRLNESEYSPKSFKDCEVILKVTFSFPLSSLINCRWDRKWPREPETGIKD